MPMNTDVSAVQRRTVRVVRQSTYTGRVLRVLGTFRTVAEADAYLNACGRRTGCTMHPWGEPRTSNRVQVR